MSAMRYGALATLRTCTVTFALVACLLAHSTSLARADAAAGADYAIQGGWFYTQANGQGGGPNEPGYAVTNDNNIPFFDTYTQAGVTTYGYPASPRFAFQGFTDQIMQKAVFQSQGGNVNFLNVMDVLHTNGKDDWLLSTYQTPPPEDTSPDNGLDFSSVQARHQTFLDSSAVLKAAYFAAHDPLRLYGLPLTHPTPEFNGQALVVRCQRAVLQLWLFDEPWARAGSVTIANGGDILKASGLISASALAPIANVPPGGSVPDPTPPTIAEAVLLTLHDLPSGFTPDVAGAVLLDNGAKTQFWLGQPPHAQQVVFNQALYLSTAQEAQAEITFVNTVVEQQAASGMTNVSVSDHGALANLGQASHAFVTSGIDANGSAVQIFDVYFAEQRFAVQVTLIAAAGQTSLTQAIHLATAVDNRIPKS